MKGVSYVYRNSVEPAIKDVNLVLEKPGLYCVVGPNGVGKSTMVKCINKLLKPTTGQVLIDGRDIKEMKFNEIAEHIGYVPVASADVFSMPAMDAILLGRKTGNKWRITSDDIEMAYRVMRIMGIQDLAMRGFKELSAGQHQKVSIARGLVQEPKMLILDEPTANLDVKHQVYVAELLRGMAVELNMIVLIISHDLNIAAKYAHQIIIMENGTVTEVGTPEETVIKSTVTRIYGVDCRIENDEGRPHVVLGSVIDM